jgi:uncharacterized membrane protein YcaP (DUF421 family)
LEASAQRRGFFRFRECSLSDVKFFFDGWEPLLRIFVVGIAGYLFLLLTLRTSGPRTVGKTNIFDFIVSVAIGGVFSRCLVDKELTLSESMFAFVLLATLQYSASSARTHFKFVRKLIDSEPHIVFCDGRFIDRLMLATRTTESDVYESVRLKGLSSMDQVAAVILEGNGDLSVIKKSDAATELVHHVQRHDPSVFARR